jgi:hypothetical protein
MKTAYISIGRNVQGTPMTAERWQEFKTALRVVGWTHGNIVTDAEGAGVYEGKTEETYLVAVSLRGPEFGRLNTIDLTNLREDLSHLAQHYGQESIALTVGEPEFVCSTKAREDFPHDLAD